jgi:hypothetical protein
MKRFTLIFSMLAISVCVFAQAQKDVTQYRLSRADDINSSVAPKNIQNSSKDTDHFPGLYFTFDESEWSASWDEVNNINIPANIPPLFKFVDVAGNEFQWHWTKIGQRGYYTGGVNDKYTPNVSRRILSTSDTRPGGEGGYLIMESDFYNTLEDGSPASPAVAMNAYFEIGGTNGLDFSDYDVVAMSFEHFHRFCCSSASTAGPFVLVSDNPAFTGATTFAVKSAEVNVFPATNPAVVELSLSDLIGGKSQIWFRFWQRTQSHYFWSVDDIKFYEPKDNNLRLNNFWADYFYYGKDEAMPYEKQPYMDTDNPGSFNDDKYGMYHGVPYQSPYWTFLDIAALRARYTNVGKYQAFDIKFKADLTKIKYNDNQVLFSAESDLVDKLSISAWDTLEHTLNPKWILPQTEASRGTYKISSLLMCDPADDDDSDNTYEYTFTITDNIFGYANPKYTTPYHFGNTGAGRVGPFGYANGKSGDAGGIIVTMKPDPSGDPRVLKGINVFIPGDLYHWNLWRDNYTFTLSGELYTETLSNTETEYFGDISTPKIETISFEIDSTYVNSWIFLPFDTDGTNQQFEPAAGGEDVLVLIRVTCQEDKDNYRWYFAADIYSHTSIGGAWFTLAERDFPMWDRSANSCMQLVCNSLALEKEPAKTKGNLNLHVFHGDFQRTGNVYANGAELTMKYSKVKEDGVQIERVEDPRTVSDNKLVFENLPFGNYGYVIKYKYNDGKDSINVTYTAAIDRQEVTQYIWINSVTSAVGTSRVIDVRYGDEYYWEPISANDIPVKPTVEVFPNPAVDYIKVDSKNANRVVISNILGQTVTVVNNPNEKISVKNFTSGIYMVTVYNNAGESATTRFVKQ